MLHPAPTAPTAGWLIWGLFMIALSFIGFMTIPVRREESHADDRKRSAHKWRASRRALDKKRKAGSELPPVSAESPEPADPSPPSASS